MYTLTVIEEYGNANYNPSTSKKLSFVECELDVDLAPIEEALELTKNSRNNKCKVLKVSEEKHENATKLYQFISPENMFDAVFQNPNFLISMKLLQYLVRNWEKVHNDNESAMFYVGRIKSLLKDLL